jgi:hypothetical protein
MLPGFRFLFAAIVLSMSILVFGLGAAALLRAAHEEFASTPTWRAAPEVVFAQPVETTRPVIALARIDTPIIDKAAEKPADNPAADATPATTTSVPVEPAPTAELKSENSPPPEIAKPETPVAETPAAERPAPNPVQTEAGSAPVEVPAAVAETGTPGSNVSDNKIADANIPDTMVADTKVPDTKVADTESANTKIAMSEEPASPVIQAATEPPSTPVSPDTSLAATRIATLGGPAVTIEKPRPVEAHSKKTDQSGVKKRQQARRAVHRRRLAARARQASQVPQQFPQQPGNPFGQPAPTIVRSR